MRRLLLIFLSLTIVSSRARAETYAVLPFFNLTKNANLDWVGESIAEALQDVLASENQITIARDDRVEAFRRLSIRPYSELTTASVIKLGQALDAEQVIFGQFDLKSAPNADGMTKSRGSLQITAHLLDLRHLKQGPELREIGALEDLAALQRHLAWQTLKYIEPKRAPSEAEFARLHPGVRMDAIENYVRGLLAMNPDEKHRLFTQAARLEPNFPQPWFQLGRLMWKRKEYKTAADWFDKVKAGDAHYNEAHFFLGLCRYSLGDFKGAEAAFQTVVQTIPLSEVYNNLAAAQSRSNAPVALDNFLKALEGDSSDPIYHFNVGYALWRSGNFAVAAERFRSVLDHDPNDSQAAMLLARAESRIGPRPNDPKSQGMERLKTNYQESAYWQLRAVLQPDKP